MTDDDQGAVAGLMAVVHRRMVAINAGDAEGVLASYDDHAVFIWDVANGKALVGKAAIREWAADLQSRMAKFRSDHTTEWRGTYLHMNWTVTDRTTGKDVFGGYDRLWGDSNRIVRHEAYWVNPEAG